MTHYVDVVALGWVEGNLREAVEVAKNCLHNYQRMPGESQHLLDARSSIHSATGALRLCALEPAALLSDEIEQVLDLLGNGSISGEARKLAMTELVAALEAIPAYLANVRAKREVTPGSVATIVNDLRQFGGRPALPEEMFADISEAEERMIQEDDLLDALGQTLQQLKSVISFLSNRKQQICSSNTELVEGVVPSLQQVSLQLHVVGLPELASTVNTQYKVLRDVSQQPNPASSEELLDFGGVISRVRDDIEFKLEYGLSAEGDTAALDLEAALTKQISVCLRGMKDNIRREFARRDLEALARTPAEGIQRTISGVRPIFRAARIAGETDLLNAAEHWDETGFPSAETLLLIASKLLGMMEDDDFTAHARSDLDQVISVLGLLEDKQPECGVLHKCAEYFDSAVDHGGLINDDSMHCFAETVAGLEQYMESRIADPQGDPSEHLSRAEANAKELDSYRLVRANLSGSDDNVLEFSSRTAKTQVADSSHVQMADLLEPIDVDTSSLDAVDAEQSAGAPVASVTGIVSWREAMSIWSTTSVEREPLPAPEGPDAEIDGELLECLVEEAGEYFSKLQGLVEKLSIDPTDKETIASIRVVFHTMKGSARTIGLTVFGEFMHDMEVIFNGLRDNYFEGTAELTEFVRYVSSQLAYFTDLIQQRIPLEASDFEIPHTIATAISAKRFDNEFTLEVSQAPQATGSEMEAEEGAPVEDELPLPYTPQFWPDYPADKLRASILVRLEDPEVKTDAVVLDQARSLGEAVFPALLELRDGGVLEPTADNVAVFLTLSGIEQLADGAIYGVVETPEGGQSRLTISEEAADTVQDYLDGIKRTNSLVQLHRSAVTLLCTCLSLEEVDDSYEPETPASDNVVPFQGTANEQVESSEIDGELLELFIETLDEYSESIDQAISGIGAGDENALRSLKNTLHTVKGAANSVGLTQLGALVHDIESRILDIEHAGTAFSNSSVTAIDTMVDEFTQATGFVRKFKADWDESASASAEEVADTAAANDPENDNASGEHKSESLRVETHRIDRLLDMGLEISMSNVRCRQSLDAAAQDRSEVQSLARRVLTLVDQLSLQLDTEIQAKTEAMPQGGKFDPLEMDRMTEKQGLAAILREAAYDLEEESRELGTHLDNALRDAQSSGRLLQTNQSELRQLRLVNFSKLGPGLRRLVHQVGRQLGKQVDFEFDCGKGGLDIRVFEQLRVALEHMLRNALDHGIGTPEERRQQGKRERGQLKLSIARSGSEFTIRLIDDGKGIDPESMRKRALETGLIHSGDELSDADALRLILGAGFTTAEQVTGISGRGVGMDVVYQSITQVGGTVEIQSKPGYFTQFDIHVPSSIMVNEALLATVGEEQIAVPLTSLKGSEFRRKDDVHAVASDPEGRISFRGNDYEVRYLGAVRGTRPTPSLDAMPDFVPILFAQLKRRRVAFFADGLDTAEDMVIRALGSQYTGVPGIAGGAVKSDGQPVLALDLNEFIGQVDYADQQAANDSSTADEGTLVLCVDDSVMMRRTYEKRLASLGYTVVTAVDGADALDYLSQASRAPDFIFTDLEMPNMNGFDFIANLRRVPGLEEVPTVVVSSRDAEKHRAEAQRVGASGFMAKGSNSAVGMQAVIERHLDTARTAMVS